MISLARHLSARRNQLIRRQSSSTEMTRSWAIWSSVESIVPKHCCWLYARGERGIRSFEVPQTPSGRVGAWATIWITIDDFVPSFQHRLSSTWRPSRGQSSTASQPTSPFCHSSPRGINIFQHSSSETLPIVFFRNIMHVRIRFADETQKWVCVWTHCYTLGLK